MKWAEVDENDIVVNTIVYDGIAELPGLPMGIRVIQINDWLNKGDNINDPEPPPVEDI